MEVKNATSGHLVCVASPFAMAMVRAQGRRSFVPPLHLITEQRQRWRLKDFWPTACQCQRVIPSFYAFFPSAGAAVAFFTRKEASGHLRGSGILILF